MSTPDAHCEASQSHPKIIIFTNSARFSLGQVVATPGSLEQLAEHGISATALIHRHVHGDWGDLCEEDRAENEFAVSRPLRLLSCYRLVDAERLASTPKERRSSLPTVWIITEADRSVTTILRPSEY